YNIYTVKRSSRNWRYKRRCCSLIPAESDSLPHAHAQTTKTYYKHQDSRIKKAQELKTKTSANSDIKDPSSETKLQGRLLESFQEDAKYEHVGQDTRSQGDKDACWDSFGEYAVHCKELSGFKYGHNIIRDVLFDICRHVRISAKEKALVNFLTDPADGRSTLKTTDVLVFGWVGGKHACVYLTGVSPLVGLSSRDFTVGQAALKATSCKVTKHEKLCIENQDVFIPFTFDTFGFLAHEAVELVNRVQRVMNSNVMIHRSTNLIFF
ncbi:hypothetical protein Tco_1286494, partial [Tanacetum coccineum]